MTKKYVLKTAHHASSLTIDYPKELNEEQHRVVTGADGHCLVLAGAGSGKTRTLIYRVAYLLEHGVRPEEVLLVTFTNKAASEMRGRVEALLQTRAKGLWCGTFHHIGNRALRMYGPQIGLSPEFGILDEEDSRDLVKACVKSLDIKDGEGRFPKPSVVQSVISFSANARLSVPEVIAKKYAYLSQFTAQIDRVRSLYSERKARTQNLDYDDLLLKWLELLRTPAAQERFAGRLRYCLVDEYQDTNRLQQELVHTLASHHGNLLVVGDDAQSIYSFRAAEIRNILEFPKTYPDAKIFKLETNYRSVKPILELANHSIKHNTHQFPKELKSVLGDGSRPQLVRVRDTRQEAAFVAQRILDFAKHHADLPQIAVLFRARYQAAELELELARRGVPYVIRGGIRFFEQAHIKDVLAYLKLLINPSDEIAWARALTLHPGIGPGWAEKLFRLLQKEGSDPVKAAAAGFGAECPPKVREGLAAFKRTLKGLLREDLLEHPDMLVQSILDSGYNKHVLMNFDNAQDRLEDLRELVNFAHTYKDLKDLLADVTLRESFKGESVVESEAASQDRDQLILSTIHQAKGLEWKVVFVIGLAEGLFPHARSMESEEELEEERRLFYVASTRAKQELILVHPLTRFDYDKGTVINRSSIFIEELPSRVYDEVEIEESQEEETIYLDD